MPLMNPLSFLCVPCDSLHLPLIALAATLAALWQNYVAGIPLYEHIVISGQTMETFQLPGGGGAADASAGSAGGRREEPEGEMAEEEVRECLAALALQVRGSAWGPPL